jgi:hypothetical protein
VTRHAVVSGPTEAGSTWFEVVCEQCGVVNGQAVVIFADSVDEIDVDTVAWVALNPVHTSLGRRENGLQWFGPSERWRRGKSIRRMPRHDELLPCIHVHELPFWLSCLSCGAGQVVSDVLTSQ